MSLKIPAALTLRARCPKANDERLTPAPSPQSRALSDF
jgi:hypothetical protein